MLPFTKNSKQCYLRVVIFILLSLPANLIAGDARKCLFETYPYFKDVFENYICLQREKKGYTCTYKWIGQLDKKAIENMSDSLINSFYRSIVDNLRFFPNNKGTRYINDDKCVRFLVEVFSDTTIYINFRDRVFETLANRTSDNVLRPYKEKILSSLVYHNMKYHFSFNAMARVAALLDCDQKEIDQLFPDKPQLTLDVQARLHNKKAISELIATFENEKTFESKISAIHGLIFSADSTAIRYVIKNFNLPVADTLYNWCVENTLQYEILTNLAFYHPDEPLFNKGIGDAIKYSFSFPNPDSVKVYYQKLYQWMDINYGVQPVDTQPFPFLRRYCRKK
jgi:hypothetical protein